MKSQISVLDQNTIDKIAAGEVVERPASVVKELVENAIDAGASAITVEVKEGGISFIRITDNGMGIDKAQVPLAFLRHATSKIRDVDDLLRISSLGFRGEALSSIAAVSQVEVITKPHEQLIGTRYMIEGGIEKGVEDIGAPDGTTFLIRNLFFNTPARAKFLKSAATEAGYISSFMEQLALSHPHISFKYMQNGQTKLHTSGNDNLKEVIYQIYGREITRELVAIDYTDETGDFQIQGFIGKPVISRGNRNFENYYVNGRYVKSKILMKAIEDAYHTFMMQHKYPFTSLYLTIRGEDVDINVHPTKMEVRFSRQEEIYRQVYQVVLSGLQKKELIPEVTIERSEDKKTEGIQNGNGPAAGKRIHAPEPFEYKRRAMEGQQNIIRETSSYMPSPTGAAKENSGSKQQPAINPPRSQEPAAHIASTEKREAPITAKDVKAPAKPESAARPKQLELFDGKLLSVEAKKHHKIIGQIFDTYWIVQMEDKLYIIDQHAAHEKVLYERIIKEIKQRTVTSQLLSPPLIISLSLEEREIMKKYMDVFTATGFEIESFGGREYSIRAVPQNLFGMTGKDFFVEILDHLEDNPAQKTPEALSDRMATMACKAAVKGNQHLSSLEAQALIDELLTLENPYNCPHGRPTIISMTKYELEKKFKRIV